MIRHTRFRFCPRCAAEALEDRDGKSLRCGACGFEYFHNIAAAVMAVLEAPGGVLLARRARDPGRGLLDLPGGFVDHGESLEQALRREIREELGLNPTALRYLGSFPNTYAYRDVVYFTADAVFAGPVPAGPYAADPEEILETVVCNPATVDPDELAFASAREALRHYLDPGRP